MSLEQAEQGSAATPSTAAEYTHKEAESLPMIATTMPSATTSTTATTTTTTTTTDTTSSSSTNFHWSCEPVVSGSGGNGGASSSPVTGSSEKSSAVDLVAVGKGGGAGVIKPADPMRPFVILVARHGHKYKPRESSNSVLSERGKQQAELLGVHIEKTFAFSVDCIFASPLARTIQTAMLIHKGLKKRKPKICIEGGLIEHSPKTSLWRFSTTANRATETKSVPTPVNSLGITTPIPTATNTEVTPLPPKPIPMTPASQAATTSTPTQATTTTLSQTSSVGTSKPKTVVENPLSILNLSAEEEQVLDHTYMSKGSTSSHAESALTVLDRVKMTLRLILQCHSSTPIPDSAPTSTETTESSAPKKPSCFLIVGHAATVIACVHALTNTNSGVPCQMASLQVLVWLPHEQRWEWTNQGDITAWEKELSYGYVDMFSSVWSNLKAWGYV